MCQHCINRGDRTSCGCNFMNQNYNQDPQSIEDEPNQHEHSATSVKDLSINNPLPYLNLPTYPQAFRQSNEFVGPNLDFVLFDDNGDISHSSGGPQATADQGGQAAFPLFQPSSTLPLGLPQSQANQFPAYDTFKPLTASTVGNLFAPLTTPAIDAGTGLMGHNPPMLSSYNTGAETGYMLDLFEDNTMPLLERTRAYDQELPMIVPPPLFAGSLNQVPQAGTQSAMYPEANDYNLVHQPIDWNHGDSSGRAYDELLPFPPHPTGYLSQASQVSQAGTQSGTWPEASFQPPLHPHTTAWNDGGSSGGLDWAIAVSVPAVSEAHLGPSDYQGQSWVPSTSAMPNNYEHLVQQHAQPRQGSLASQGHQGRRHSSGLTATHRNRAVREERRDEILGRRQRPMLRRETAEGDEQQAALGLMQLSRGDSVFVWE